MKIIEKIKTHFRKHQYDFDNPIEYEINMSRTHKGTVVYVQEPFPEVYVVCKSCGKPVQSYLAKYYNSGCPGVETIKWQKEN